MINLDLSKALHPGFWDLLPTFMPGLFFEIYVLLAEPDWVSRTLSHAQLERYAGLGVALKRDIFCRNAARFLRLDRTICDERHKGKK